MTEPQVLYRGAGKAREVQKEITLQALPPEERALSVAADCFLSARLADGPLRRSLVRLAAGELVKHFPEQIRAAAWAGK